MPRVSAKILEVRHDEEGRLVAKVQFHRRAPKVGEYFTAKWGSLRTLPQNSLYWVYLTWLINEAGLKDKGHFCAEALHQNLKERFKTETTTTMDKVEFSGWFEMVDKFIQEFFDISTAPFWQIYDKNYAL